jgi:hypothetical protein
VTDHADEEMAADGLLLDEVLQAVQRAKSSKIIRPTDHCPVAYY